MYSCTNFSHKYKQLTIACRENFSVFSATWQTDSSGLTLNLHVATAEANGSDLNTERERALSLLNRFCVSYCSAIYLSVCVCALSVKEVGEINFTQL